MSAVASIRRETERRRRPQPIGLRIVQLVRPETGEPVRALIAASATDRDALRARKYRDGETVFATVKKPRNPGFHRLAHALGRLVSENVEAFEGLDAHRALKRLQIESGAACDEVRIDGGFVCRIPLSLSYESLDEGEFRQAVTTICRWIAQRYWTSCTPEQIEQMAEAMPND